jgi:hypothetical protein
MRMALGPSEGVYLLILMVAPNLGSAPKRIKLDKIFTT